MAQNDTAYPWMNRRIAEGVKGPIHAQVKCIRGVACRSQTRHGNYVTAEEDVWLYIRKYENGTIKYFLSNASGDTDLKTLDQLATKRWSIEQCFQECKSHLGMADYETRTYGAWHRHMLCVMIAHLFTIQLRLRHKKSFILRCP